MITENKNVVKRKKTTKRQINEKLYHEILNLRESIENTPPLRIDIYTNQWHYNVSAYPSDLKEL